MGALSDRIGRKRIDDGRLPARRAVLHPDLSRDAARRRAPDVVTAISQRNPVTGAISLTPQTMVDGALKPAPEVLPFTGVRASCASNRGRVEADRCSSSCRWCS